MRATRKGILPDSRLPMEQAHRRPAALHNDLEMRLNTANRRIRKLEGENELLRRNANRPYSWLASPDEAGKEEGGDE